MSTVAQLMTAEELARLPAADGQRYELIQGELVTMPPSGGEHGVFTTEISYPVIGFVKQHDLGVCCGAETGFIIARDPDTVRAPDLAFVRKERIPPTGVPKEFWP